MGFLLTHLLGYCNCHQGTWDPEAVCIQRKIFLGNVSNPSGWIVFTIKTNFLKVKNWLTVKFCSILLWICMTQSLQELANTATLEICPQCSITSTLSTINKRFRHRKYFKEPLYVLSIPRYTLLSILFIIFHFYPPIIKARNLNVILGSFFPLIFTTY